jgi:hypothetical protein
MSKTPRERRSNLSESCHKRLNMYALAASAAGVGLLAVAEPSQAKIIFTHAHKVIPPETSFFLDLNHDRISDFGLFIRTDRLTSVLSVYGYGRNQAWGPTSGRLASALPAGVRVGPKNQKRPIASLQMAYWKCISNPASTCSPFRTGGQFANVKDRFLGLKFFIQGKVHFGWARFDVSIQNGHQNSTMTATLTGYAYETIPGKPIITGQTTGADQASTSEQPTPPALISPSPEPDALGLLALGSPGLSIWRREKSPLQGKLREGDGPPLCL